jgi:hypothetical protein
MKLRPLALATISILAVLPSLGACTAVMTNDSPAAGGAAAGGTSAGGSGGTAAGGTGGTAAGGTGGTAAGGTASGGSGGTGGATGGSGTGGSGGAEDFNAIPFGPTFQFVRRLLKQQNPDNCLGADCHGGTPAHINLALDDGLYERITTAMSDDVCLDSEGMPMKLIVPGDPEASAFLRILKEPCENEGRMPGGICTDPNQPCPSALLDEYIGYIETWIANGALETEPEGGTGGAGTGGASAGGTGGTP